MRLFLGFVLGALFIFCIIGLLSLLLPSKVTVTKSVWMEAPANDIHLQISNLANWKNWYPPMQGDNVSIRMDSSGNNMVHSVFLKDEKGREVLLHLIKATPDTIVVRAEKHTSTKIVYQFVLHPQKKEKIQLTLNVNAHFQWYPWEKIKGIFFDKLSGPQYESVLQSLKEFVEETN